MYNKFRKVSEFGKVSIFLGKCQSLGIVSVRIIHLKLSEYNSEWLDMPTQIHLLLSCDIFQTLHDSLFFSKSLIFHLYIYYHVCSPRAHGHFSCPTVTPPPL